MRYQNPLVLSRIMSTALSTHAQTADTAAGGATSVADAIDDRAAPNTSAIVSTIYKNETDKNGNHDSDEENDADDDDDCHGHRHHHRSHHHHHHHRSHHRHHHQHHHRDAIDKIRNETESCADKQSSSPISVRRSDESNQDEVSGERRKIRHESSGSSSIKSSESSSSSSSSSSSTSSPSSSSTSSSVDEGVSCSLFGIGGDSNELILDPVNQSAIAIEVPATTLRIELGPFRAATELHADPGDIIEFDRILSSHWAIYVGDDDVVQVVGSAEQEVPDCEIAIVQRVSITAAAGESCCRVNNKILRAKERNLLPFNNEIVVRKALSKVGSTVPYNVLQCNSEHYVTEWKYGHRWSDQAAVSLNSFKALRRQHTNSLSEGHALFVNTLNEVLNSPAVSAAAAAAAASPGNSSCGNSPGNSATSCTSSSPPPPRAYPYQNPHHHHQHHQHHHQHQHQQQLTSPSSSAPSFHSFYGSPPKYGVNVSPGVVGSAPISPLAMAAANSATASPPHRQRLLSHDSAIQIISRNLERTSSITVTPISAVPSSPPLMRTISSNAAFGKIVNVSPLTLTTMVTKNNMVAANKGFAQSPGDGRGGRATNNSGGGSLQKQHSII